MSCYSMLRWDYIVGEIGVSCTSANIPTAWKLHFDGHGQGGFEGERQPTAAMELQEYYHRIQKAKDQLLG